MPSNLIERNKPLTSTFAAEPKHALAGDKLAESQPSVHNRSKVQSKRRLLRIALVGISLVTTFVAGWWLATNQNHKNDRVSLPSSEATFDADKMVVTASRVTYRPIERFVEAVGTLHAFEEIVLSSKQEGRVLKIHHDLSSVVKPGELLLELDPIDARLAYEQAERAVQMELAKWGFQEVPNQSYDLNQLPTVVSARLKFELAQSKLQRLLPLQASKSVSADDLEQAKSDALVQQSDWQNQLLLAKSAAASARLKNAELAIADQRLKDLSLRAPIPSLNAGEANNYYTINERLVSEGTLVRPGTEVFRLVMGRTLKLKLSIPEAFSGQIRPDQSVSVATSTSDLADEGRIARISPTIDRTTRTFLVEVEIPNSQSQLKPGGFAKAKILVGKDQRATTIPLAGLYSFAGINKIFTVESDSETVREIKVSLGEQSSDWIEIAAPKLPENATVVTSGQRLLSDGASVTIRNSESHKQKDDRSANVQQTSQAATETSLGDNR